MSENTGKKHYVFPMFWLSVVALSFSIGAIWGMMVGFLSLTTISFLSACVIVAAEIHNDMTEKQETLEWRIDGVEERIAALEVKDE